MRDAGCEMRDARGAGQTPRARAIGVSKTDTLRRCTPQKNRFRDRVTHNPRPSLRAHTGTASRRARSFSDLSVSAGPPDGFGLAVAARPSGIGPRSRVLSGVLAVWAGAMATGIGGARPVVPRPRIRRRARRQRSRVARLAAAVRGNGVGDRAHARRRFHRQSTRPLSALCRPDECAASRAAPGPRLGLLGVDARCPTRSAQRSQAPRARTLDSRDRRRVAG